MGFNSNTSCKSRKKTDGSLIRWTLAQISALPLLCFYFKRYEVFAKICHQLRISFFRRNCAFLRRIFYERRKKRKTAVAAKNAPLYFCPVFSIFLPYYTWYFSLYMDSQRWFRQWRNILQNKTKKGRKYSNIFRIFPLYDSLRRKSEDLRAMYFFICKFLKKMYVRPCESNKRLDERTTDGKKRNVHSNGKR